MTPTNIALAYARRGLPVLALRARGKEPFPLLAPRGVYSATTDEATIRSMLSRASVNLGVATGHAAWVLDIDPRHGGDEHLGELERRHGSLPNTPRVLTGGGGTHFYFAMPSEGARFRKDIAPGVECKGVGGYVVAPPSRHPNGTLYRWDLGALLSETPFAIAPRWLLDSALERGKKTFVGESIGSAADSFYGVAFAAANWIGRPLTQGKYAVRCPWAHLHSDNRGCGDDSSSVLLPPTNDARLGAFVCVHAHCADRSTSELIAALPADALRAALKRFPDATGAIRRCAARDARGRTSA